MSTEPKPYKCRVVVYILAAVIGVLFGLEGHYRAMKVERAVLLKDDTLHVVQKEAQMLTKMNVALQSATGVNAARINTMYEDVEELKQWKDTLQVKK